MKKTINQYEFMTAFQSIRPDNFSRNGLFALFQHLTEWELDTGEEIELDVIGICCEFTEYTMEEVLFNYSCIRDNLREGYDESDVLEALQNHTIAFDVLQPDKTITFIVQDF